MMLQGCFPPSTFDFIHCTAFSFIEFPGPFLILQFVSRLERRGQQRCPAAGSRDNLEVVFCPNEEPEDEYCDLST